MEQEITVEMLDREIAAHPQDTELYVRRGKLHYAATEFGRAANDFSKALELDPSSVEAEQFLILIEDILSYKYTDQFNP